jgi:hypothetical protein
MALLATLPFATCIRTVEIEFRGPNQIDEILNNLRKLHTLIINHADSRVARCIGAMFDHPTLDVVRFSNPIPPFYVCTACEQLTISVDLRDD